MKKCLVVITILALVAVLATGCIGAPSPMPTPSETPMPTLPAGMGTLEVRVTDAPPEYDIETIDVTFSEVRVHKAGDDGEDGVWITIEIIDDGELELLELQEEDLEALLATDEVTAGKYTQLRVIIDTIVVTLAGDGEPPEVILPSGELKFVRPFEVVDGETTILLLDFDADKSLTVTGDGKIIVKPVVKLFIEHEEALGTIAGTVTDSDTDTTGDPIEGATVEVDVDGTILSATTDKDGDYEIDDVPVGTYTVIASAEGYEDDSQEVTVSADTTSTADFELDPE